jgi:hypothetical protein
MTANQRCHTDLGEVEMPSRWRRRSCACTGP